MIFGERNIDDDIKRGYQSPESRDRRLEGGKSGGQPGQQSVRDISVTQLSSGHHGQRQSHPADQQHAVSGQDGEVAALQEY